MKSTNVFKAKLSLPTSIAARYWTEKPNTILLTVKPRNILARLLARWTTFDIRLDIAVEHRISFGPLTIWSHALSAEEIMAIFELDKTTYFNVK